MWYEIKEGIKMLCPNCKKDIADGSKFCGHCGFGLIENKEKSSNDKEEQQFDEKGLVVKQRNGLGILSFFLGGFLYNIVNKLPDEYTNQYGFVILILWVVGAYFIYYGIKAYSSHDIDTWKHRKYIKTWIYAGCLLAGIVGIIAYYFFKGREEKYVLKQRRAENIENTVPQ